jgi:hypothetical protein
MAGPRGLHILHDGVVLTGVRYDRQWAIGGIVSQRLSAERSLGARRSAGSRHKLGGDFGAGAEMLED